MNAIYDAYLNRELNSSDYHDVRYAISHGIHIEASEKVRRLAELLISEKGAHLRRYNNTGYAIWLESADGNAWTESTARSGKPNGNFMEYKVGVNCHFKKGGNGIEYLVANANVSA
jgi:hypothetical protein